MYISSGWLFPIFFSVFETIDAMIYMLFLFVFLNINAIILVLLIIDSAAWLIPFSCLFLCNSDSGFVPIFVYTIFGSSRQLAIGPVALTSLLVSNVLGNIVDSSEQLYTDLAILLALMVGVLECIMGLLRCCFTGLAFSFKSLWLHHSV